MLLYTRKWHHENSELTQRFTEETVYFFANRLAGQKLVDADLATEIRDLQLAFDLARGRYSQGITEVDSDGRQRTVTIPSLDLRRAKADLLALLQDAEVQLHLAAIIAKRPTPLMVGHVGFDLKERPHLGA